MSGSQYFCLQREYSEAALDRARASVQPFARAVQAARQDAGPDALVAAWISDIHLHSRRPYPHPLCFYGEHVDSSANFRLAIAEIVALDPDLLILGGDIIDTGWHQEMLAGEYEEMKRILDAAMPASMTMLPLLGNHDHADAPLSAPWAAAFAANRRSNWPKPVEQEDFYYEARFGGWRFIAIDSRQNQPLSDRQCAWLSDRLQADAVTPTIVLVHRPYLSVGNWVDYHQLTDRRSFDILDRSDAVKLVLSGHTHKSAAWTYRDKTHVVFPACAYGIPDPCGWGVVVLSATQVREVFIKNLAAATYDNVGRRYHCDSGAFRVLSRPEYTTDPLFDPCRLP
ncbi:MAG: metallophosphoesterase [Phycisphaeraceae bacterium]|nr:metallophosphoesterase [Phycisphaeraceae bacterium]